MSPKDDNKLIPDYILELLQQSIEMVEGEIYPKDMIELVPGILRKVKKQLERRNSEEYLVSRSEEHQKKYLDFIGFFQEDNGRKLGLRIGDDIPTWILNYFKKQLGMVE